MKAPARLIALALVLATPAVADTMQIAANEKGALPIRLPIDPLNLNNGAGTSVNAPGAVPAPNLGPLAELADLLNSDFIAAAKAATADPDLQDVNGAACWAAFEPLGRVIKEHPAPVTLRLATDIESLRKVNIIMQRLCANPACTAVFNEAAAWAQRIAQAAPIHVNIPNVQFNVWGKACADMPSIQAPTAAVATPVSAPTPAPSPTPSRDN